MNITPEIKDATGKTPVPFEWFLLSLHFMDGYSLAEAHRNAMKLWQGESSETISLRKARELMKRIDPDLVKLASGHQDAVSSIVRILKGFLSNPQSPVPFLISYEARRVAMFQISESMRRMRRGSKKATGGSSSKAPAKRLPQGGASCGN